MSRNGAMAMPRCRCPRASSRRRRPNMSGRSTGLADPPARLSGQLCADGRPCRTAGRSPGIRERRMAWLTHCYATRRRRPRPRARHRHRRRALCGDRPCARATLDRNIANVGRVIEGIGLLSARPRGTGNLGFYQADRGETPIPIRAHPPRRRHARGRAARTSR